jgi:hypothetical protein
LHLFRQHIATQEEVDTKSVASLMSLIKRER